jgi:hypothetical protein
MPALRMLSAALALCAGISAAGIAQAQDRPAATSNRCWGEIASGLAQYESPNVTEEMNGGSMGMHTRSSAAAIRNGGFNDPTVNPFGATQPRQGVGNVSRDPDGLHHTAPGDGGNGQHAVNNGQLSAVIDPVTGQPMGGAGEPIECSLALEDNLPF